MYARQAMRSASGLVRWAAVGVPAAPCPAHTSVYTCWRACSSRVSAAVSSVTPHPSSTSLQVFWKGGGSDVYPYLWLRDNCQCPNCFHSTAFARMIPLDHLHPNTSPKSVQVSETGVEVEWTDGHLASYPADWLHRRAFDTTRHTHQQCLYKLPKKLWGSELSQALPTASFPSIMADDAALLNFLTAVEQLGVVVVRGVREGVGEIQRLTERVGHLKVTHYGKTFTVKEEAKPDNLAYTTSTLDMHSDQPYLCDTPGIQLLHCIVQFSGDGGDNLLADAFHAASHLRQHQRQHYHLLTDTIVDFEDTGTQGSHQYHAISRRPMIQLDHDGSLDRINFNQMVRSSVFQVGVERATAWYNAMLAFRDLVYHPQYQIKYKLKAGEMLVFDNLRLLHGRLGYTSSEGARHLEGGYWNWDEVRSRRRVLSTKLGQS